MKAEAAPLELETHVQPTEPVVIELLPGLKATHLILPPEAVWVPTTNPKDPPVKPVVKPPPTKPQPKPR